MTAATGASTGCGSRPSSPRARPGKPSSTTGCPWRCDNSWIIWPRAAPSSAASTSLAFGLPGTGKTHALCALGHRLVEAGHSVLFAQAYRLVQELLAAKRDLDLPRRLRKLDNFDFLLLDDVGYLPQGAEESEVLLTLIAERYERRSLGITSNLVFSEWERIFATPWPPPPQSTGSCTTPSSWSLTSPATGLMQPSNGPCRGGEPAKLIDAKSVNMVDAGQQRYVARQAYGMGRETPTAHCALHGHTVSQP